MTPRRMNQILKVVLICLIIGAGGGLYFANKTLTSIAVDTTKLKADVEIGQKQLSTYQLTQAKVDSLGFVDDLANKVLPQDEDQSAIVAEISQFAARYSMGVDNISFPDTKPTTKSGLATPKGVSVLPIVVTFQPGANYSAVLNFLKTIETNQRKMQVTNLTLQPDPVNRSTFTKVSIAINIYARTQSPGSNK